MNADLVVVTLTAVLIVDGCDLVSVTHLVI